MVPSKSSFFGFFSSHWTFGRWDSPSNPFRVSRLVVDRTADSIEVDGCEPDQPAGLGIDSEAQQLR